MKRKEVITKIENTEESLKGPIAQSKELREKADEKVQYKDSGRAIGIHGGK